MKRIVSIVSVLAVSCGVALVADAQEDRFARGMSYDVTVTNATRGQILSPPIVVVHDPALALFDVGEPASEELAALAEDADAAGLIAVLAGLLGNGVDDYAVADGVVMPGGSVALEVSADRGCRVLSMVSMLVTTNDAFAAIRSTPLHGCGTTINRGGLTVHSVAYDAGSEANTESCDHIPGPPCGSAFVHVGDGAEGFVHVHAGIHGIADLMPAVHDWRNPVAEVHISRN